MLMIDPDTVRETVLPCGCIELKGGGLQLDFKPCEDCAQDMDAARSEFVRTCKGCGYSEEGSGPVSCPNCEELDLE